MFAILVKYVKYVVFLFHRLTQKNNTIVIRFSPPKEKGKMLVMEFIPQNICDLLRGNLHYSPNLTKMEIKEYTERRTILNQMIKKYIRENDPKMQDTNMSEGNKLLYTFHETCRISQMVYRVYVNKEIKDTISEGAEKFTLNNYGFIRTAIENWYALQYFGE